jgi:hypothetical protein
MSAADTPTPQTLLLEYWPMICVPDVFNVQETVIGQLFPVERRVTDIIEPSTFTPPVAVPPTLGRPFENVIVHVPVSRDPDASSAK